MSDDVQNAETKPAKSRTMTVKTIEKIAAQINAMTDPVAARKRRKKLGDRILVQIAAEKIKNPVAAAQAFVNSFATTPETDSPEA